MLSCTYGPDGPSKTILVEDRCGVRHCANGPGATRLGCFRGRNRTKQRPTISSIAAVLCFLLCRLDCLFADPPHRGARLPDAAKSRPSIAVVRSYYGCFDRFSWHDGLRVGADDEQGIFNWIFRKAGCDLLRRSGPWRYRGLDILGCPRQALNVRNPPVRDVGNARLQQSGDWLLFSSAGWGRPNDCLVD